MPSVSTDPPSALPTTAAAEAAEVQEPTCRHCFQQIHQRAAVCHHCGHHQRWLFASLPVAQIISLGLFILAILQFNEAMKQSRRATVAQQQARDALERAEVARDTALQAARASQSAEESSKEIQDHVLAAARRVNVLEQYLEALFEELTRQQENRGGLSLEAIRTRTTSRPRPASTADGPPE